MLPEEWVGSCGPCGESVYSVHTCVVCPPHTLDGMILGKQACRSQSLWQISEPDHQVGTLTSSTGGVISMSADLVDNSLTATVGFIFCTGYTRTGLKPSDAEFHPHFQ